MKTKKSWVIPLSFVVIQMILYTVILTSGGKLQVWSEYASIVLCFLFALLHFKDGFIIAGLAMTLCADYCLVICDPMQQLWGMVFFLGAQIFYAVTLSRGKTLLYIRLGLILAAEAVTILVLGKNTDALALVSLCYYANLIMNIVCAFARWREHKSMAIALVLFLLCDTVIGLQVMGGMYLPIGDGSLLSRILYPGFDLAWFFYLPSQVLLALQNKISRY